MTPSICQLGLLAVAVTAALGVVFGVPPRALAQTDPKASADEHFKRGVAAVDDGYYGDADKEFSEAYRLWPAYAVLYNIGQVKVALGQSVEAVDAFERYLKHGASQIPAPRVREVQAEIVKQQDRIGTVVLQTTPDGAELRMDGKLLGTAPLGHQVRATIGPHTFEAMLAGYLPRVQEVEVVGRAERRVTLSLEKDPVRVADETRRAAEEAHRAVAASRSAPAPAPALPVVTLVQIPPSGATGAGTRTSGTTIAPPESTNWQRIAGYVLFAGGLATTTAGGLIAYDGSNKAADSRRLPTTTAEELQAATAAYDAANHRNHVGWTVAGAGAAVLLGGIVLIATAPDHATRTNVALSLTPVVSEDLRGAAWRRTW